MHITTNTSQGVVTPFKDKRVSISYAGKPDNYQLYSIDPTVAAEKVISFSEKVGVASGDIYMPNISSSNGRVGQRYKFRRSAATSRILNNEKADGVTIIPGESAVFATGDCPVVVMYGPKTNFVISAHAGRQSLLGAFHDSIRHELSDSVLFDMTKRFSFNELRSVEVAVFLSIGAKHFDHLPKHQNSVYRESNKRMIDFVSSAYGKGCFADVKRGTLSLLELIKAQCRLLGIDPKRVWSDGFDTFSTKLADGSHAFWSNRRGDKGRNIVLVSMT